MRKPVTGAVSLSLASEPNDTHGAGCICPEVLDFFCRVGENGVAVLCLSGRWSAGRVAERPSLRLIARSAAGATALTPLPSWETSASPPAEPGATWRLEFRVPESTIAAELEYTLEWSTSQVLELKPPHREGEQRSTTGSPPRDEFAEVVEEAAPAAGSTSRRLDERTRMLDAVATQNRALRARIAELEDALDRATHAAKVARQLQQLIETEASVSQAQSDLDVTRNALRSGLFAREPVSVGDLQKVAEQERAARDAIEECVDELEALRANVVRADPEHL